MRRLRRHPVLVVVTVGLATLEALLVVAVGPTDAAPLAPQVAAPAPFGVFHDLRWLLVYHPSWVVFVVGAIALIAGRAALDCALVRAAWPEDRPAPSTRQQLRHAIRFTAVAALTLVLFAVLTFALAVTSLSWLFFVAVPVLLMVALLLHHGEVTPVWWRDPPSRRSVTSILWVFVLLSAGGAVIAAVPRAVAPVVAGVTGLAVAACRVRSVEALAFAAHARAGSSTQAMAVRGRRARRGARARRGRHGRRLRRLQCGGGRARPTGRVCTRTRPVHPCSWSRASTRAGTA